MKELGMTIREKNSNDIHITVRTFDFKLFSSFVIRISALSTMTFK